MPEAWARSIARGTPAWAARWQSRCSRRQWQPRPTGGLPLSRILKLGIPLASALVAAHERGVIHRDLKPGNVMVTDEGWVKVLDFGLAKTAANSPASKNVTIGATAESPTSGEGQAFLNKVGLWD